MSIARSLERTIDKMEVVRLRGNGDLEAVFPLFVADLRADIARVRGLEEMESLSTQALKEFQEQGGHLDVCKL
jgi:hypothetical protein